MRDHLRLHRCLDALLTPYEITLMARLVIGITLAEGEGGTQPVNVTPMLVSSGPWYGVRLQSHL